MQSDAEGDYLLAGLPPGTYKVEVTGPTGAIARLVTLQVGQTASLDLGLAAAQENIESVTVTATQLFETRTSEVATYVTPKQIEALPQNSRNFLAFADIVPGVQFATNADGSTSQLRSGAQSANGVNVFIDGVGQKNYVLRGGVERPDAHARQSVPAARDRRVQGHHVELQSGVRPVEQRRGRCRDALRHQRVRVRRVLRQDLRELARVRSDRGKRRPSFESKQEQYGIAFGGPIIQDKMHFFVTYEGKEFETPETVRSARASCRARSCPTSRRCSGPWSAPFEEDLYFAKIDWLAGDDHLFELTGKRRKETEISNIGDSNTATFASDKKNDETRVDLRYQFTSARFLNDAHITWEDAAFNRVP